MKVNPFKKRIFSFFMLSVVLLLHGCNSDDNCIPDVTFKLYVDLNVYNELTTPGYSMLFKEYGYGGVIIYCENYDVDTPSESVYYAYDAACPYEACITESDTCTCAVELVDNGSTAVCPCCGSKFLLLSGGYPYEGDATAGLKQYNVSVLNDELYVSN